jgi:hypothetical protein
MRIVTTEYVLHVVKLLGHLCWYVLLQNAIVSHLWLFRIYDEAVFMD